MLCNLTGYAIFSFTCSQEAEYTTCRHSKKQIISDTSKNQEYQISVFLFASEDSFYLVCEIKTQTK